MRSAEGRDGRNSSQELVNHDHLRVFGELKERWTDVGTNPTFVHPFRSSKG